MFTFFAFFANKSKPCNIFCEEIINLYDLKKNDADINLCTFRIHMN